MFNRKEYNSNPNNRAKHAEAQRAYIKRKTGRVVLRKPKGSGLTSKERTRQMRLRVLNHYGHGNPKCVCCGESHFQFLALDHIEGGGNEHRKSIRGPICWWIEKNNYPDGFQILCHNCNQAKGYYGECPHAVMLPTKK